MPYSTLTRINEVLEEVPLWATRVVGNIPFFNFFFFFFFSEKPTGPNRFRAVLTQLVPGTHGPIPYPGSGNVPGHAGETITSAGSRLANSEFHTRHKSPEPCAFLRRTYGREGETQWAAGSRHPRTRRAAKTPGGPAAATNQTWPGLVRTRSQFTTLPTEALCKPLEKRSDPVNG